MGWGPLPTLSKGGVGCGRRHAQARREHGAALQETTWLVGGHGREGGGHTWSTGQMKCGWLMHARARRGLAAELWQHGKGWRCLGWERWERRGILCVCVNTLENRGRRCGAGARKRVYLGCACVGARCRMSRAGARGKGGGECGVCCVCYEEQGGGGIRVPAGSGEARLGG